MTADAHPNRAVQRGGRHRLSEPPVSTASAAAKGTRWTVAAMIVRQFGRLGFAVVLARLLGPTDFGVVAAATIYIALTAVLLEAGLSSSIVQKSDLRPADEGVTFWTLTAIGLLMAGMTVAGSDVIAAFLGIPDLGQVLQVLAIGPVLKGMANVAAAKLQRDLRFRAMAITEISATVLGGVAGIVAAELGARYWSLVVQQLSTDALVLVMWFVAAGLPKLVVDREAFRYLRVFGLPLVGAQVVGYFTRNVDNVIVSRALGQTALSFYVVPYRIMLVPVGILGNVANRVAFPIFARLQDQPDRVRDVFLRITRTIAVAVVPSMIGVAVLAPEVVETVFGPEWRPSVPVVQALALTGILQSLTTAGGSVFMGLGRADMSFRWAVLPLFVLIPSFFAGLPWGVTGVAVSYSIASALVTPFLVRAIGRLASFTVLDWVRAIAPTFIATVPAVAVTLLVREMSISLGAPAPVTAAIGLSVLTVTYVLTLRLIDVSLYQQGMSAAGLLLRGKLVAGS